MIKKKVSLYIPEVVNIVCVIGAVYIGIVSTSFYIKLCAFLYACTVVLLYVFFYTKNKEKRIAAYAIYKTDTQLIRKAVGVAAVLTALIVQVIPTQPLLVELLYMGIIGCVLSGVLIYVIKNK